MNEEEKKVEEQVESNVDVSVSEENVNVENNTDVSVEVSQEQVVEPVVENTPVEVDNETVIEANVNEEANVEDVATKGTIEEVTVEVDSDAFNSLDEAEVSEKSVFNKVEESTVTGMKEGQEHLTEKKGFPFFMVLMLILVIVIAFNIDSMGTLVEKVKNLKKQPEVTDEKKKEEKEENLIGKDLSLDDIKKALDSSSVVTEFEKTNNIELNSTIVENKLIITTTNYLNIPDVSNLTVEFVHVNHILTANVELNNSEFGKEMSVILIKEIGSLQEMDAIALDNYLREHLYEATLDMGFELTNSEDGNNTYRIMTNVKFKIA